MIRVTVEVVPQGREAGKFTVGEATLYNRNEMSSDGLHGNYGFVFDGDWQHYNQGVEGFQAAGTVTGFPRAEGGVWALLAEALKYALEQNGQGDIETVKEFVPWI